jgi:hypothetical protein
LHGAWSEREVNIKVKDTFPKLVKEKMKEDVGKLKPC